jgi:hypothetical protein
MINKGLEEFIKDEVKAFEERLRAKAEELQGQMNDNPKNIWDLDIDDGEEYYRLYWDGDVDQGVFNTNYDERIRDMGNAFLTREEAEFEVERRKIEAVMKKYSRPFKRDEDNWYIEYNYDNNKIHCYCNWDSSLGVSFFESREIVKKIIDEIGRDRLVKYWFGVTE